MRGKDFISDWVEHYQSIFRQTRLISQIPVFVFAVISFCEIGRVFATISVADNVAWDIVINVLALQSLLVFLYLTRFFLLFSKSKIYFGISQLIWLTYFIVLVNFNGFIFAGGRGCFYYFSVFDVIIIFYPAFSLVRQVGTLIFSVAKVFKNKGFISNM